MELRGALRIAVEHPDARQLRLVVTMTGCIEDGSEDRVFGRILDEFLTAAVRNRSGNALPPAPKRHEALQARLAAARGWPKLAADVEPRMVPSVAPKEQRVPFEGADAPTRQRR